MMADVVMTAFYRVKIFKKGRGHIRDAMLARSTPIRSPPYVVRWICISEIRSHHSSGLLTSFLSQNEQLNIGLQSITFGTTPYPELDGRY